MPLTFPSHAAAILPLWSAERAGGPASAWARRLHPTALIIGSMAPDLVYPLRWSAVASHQPQSLLTFCLPAGLLLFLWAEALALPVLVEVVPEIGDLQPGRLLRTRGLPSDLLGWLGVAAALLMGAITHILWDGFTHDGMWPAAVLYPGVALRAGGHTLTLAHALQYLSSLLGALAVYAFAARRYPLLQAAPGGTWRDLGRLGLIAAAGAGLVLLLRLYPLPHTTSLRRTIWFAGWTAVNAGFLGLTLACAVYRLERRVPSG